jgi:hypothetical protein
MCRRNVFFLAVALETTVQSKRHELQGLIAKRSNQARALKVLSYRALSGFRAVVRSRLAAIHPSRRHAFEQSRASRFCEGAGA